MSSREIAEILGLNVRILADWRYQGKHLWFYKIGGSVRYDWADVDAFLVRHRNEIDPDQNLTVSEARTLGRQLKTAREVLAANPQLSVMEFMKAGGVSGLR